MRYVCTKSYRQEQTRGYTFITYVDADCNNYKDFTEELYKNQPWGHNQNMNMSYFHPAKNSYDLVQTDQDMMAMFDIFSNSKYIELNVIFVPKTADESVTMPRQMLEKDMSAMLSTPCTPAIDVPSQICGNEIEQPSQVAVTESTSLANPFPMFEHVGVNEEGLYGQDVPDEDSDDSEDSEEDLEDTSEEDVESSDDEANCNEVGSDHDKVVIDYRPTNIPQVAYDKDDPPMTIGSTYESIQEFRIALCSHAIKYEFEYNVEKTDPDRVRAYCAAKKRGCKWRLHASTLEDRVTVQASIVVV